MKQPKFSTLLAIVIALAAVLWIASGTIGRDTSPAPVETATEMQAGAGAGDMVTPATEEDADELMAVRVRDLAAEEFINNIVITGRTQSSRDVEIRAETEGQIEEIFFPKGERVSEGDIIARIEEGGRQARFAEAQERVTQAEIQYNATASLQKKGLSSDVRVAETAAALETARAVLEEARLELDNIFIKAPFAGTIYEQNIERGDFVDRGDPLVTIVDLDPVEIVGFVTEAQVLQIGQGAVAHATLLDDTEISGTVTYIAPAANTETRTFRIEIEVPNASMKIVEGMTARIFIPVAARKAHKISPAILSLDDQGRVGVKIVGPESRVAFAPIEILADTSEGMWIGGLPETVRVITVGQEFVAAGQEVRPVPAEGDGLL